ncbi:MAG: hypothetical protein PGN26_06240 [Xylophilus ampelinus]
MPLASVRGAVPALQRAGAAAVGVACLAAGLALAVRHPVAPLAAGAVFCAWCLAALRWPGLWLFVVPAALPALNFSPWTGWIAFEEFDLLLLGTLAAAWLRQAAARDAPAAPPSPWPGRLALAVLAWGALGLARGVAAAGGWSGGAGGALFGGYLDPVNAWRVFKGPACAALLLPALQRECAVRGPLRAGGRLAAGMLAGLCVALGAAIWERAAFPGLSDTAGPYRTVALFWEMHVGGAAIDAYLAMAVPFVLWALARARTPPAWAGAALLTLAAGYVCLTTFARGVYLSVTLPALLAAALAAVVHVRGAGAAGLRRIAVAVPAAAAGAAGTGLLVAHGGLAGAALALAAVACALAGLRIVRRPLGRRWEAGALLACVLVAEVVAFSGSGSFLQSRVAASQADLGSRLDHWRRGAALLRSPADWALGLGLGRLPARYAAAYPLAEFPGTAHGVPTADGGTAVRLAGPGQDSRRGRYFALTQRVDAAGPGPLRVTADIAVRRPAMLQFRVCERHLLYTRACRRADLLVLPGAQPWQRVSVLLQGPALPEARGWRAPPRLAMFSVAAPLAGTAAEIGRLSLARESAGAPPRELLANGDFAAGLARWWPAAQGYFLPWHIDNLLLEALIERGLAGVVLLYGALALAVRGLLPRRGAAGAEALGPLAPVLAAALAGAALIGAVSSVLDVPRDAFLLHLLLFFALAATAGRRQPLPDAARLSRPGGAA